MSQPDLTLADILPQQQNVNAHTERGMAALEQSIQQDGLIGAITVAANGETFDGSARREVLELLEVKDAIIIRGDGSRPVIYIREDIPTAEDPRAVRLGLAANRVPMLNFREDPTVLQAIIDQCVALPASLYTDQELGYIMGRFAEGSPYTLEEPETAPEPVHGAEEPSAHGRSAGSVHTCPSCGHSWSEE